MQHRGEACSTDSLDTLWSLIDWINLQVELKLGPLRRVLLHNDRHSDGVVSYGRLTVSLDRNGWSARQIELLKHEGADTGVIAGKSVEECSAIGALLLVGVRVSHWIEAIGLLRVLNIVEDVFEFRRIWDDDRVVTWVDDCDIIEEDLSPLLEAIVTNSGVLVRVSDVVLQEHSVDALVDCSLRSNPHSVWISVFIDWRRWDGPRESLAQFVAARWRLCEVRSQDDVHFVVIDRVAGVLIER